MHEETEKKISDRKRFMKKYETGRRTRGRHWTEIRQEDDMFLFYVCLISLITSMRTVHGTGHHINWLKSEKRSQPKPSDTVFKLILNRKHTGMQNYLLLSIF